jgi:uncharacterized membrane protein
MTKSREALIGAALLLGAIISGLLCTIAGEMVRSEWPATRIWSTAILTAPLAALAWPARGVFAGRIIAIVTTVVNVIADIAFVILTVHTPQVNVKEMFDYFGPVAPVGIALWVIWQVVAAAALFTPPRPKA